MKMKNIFVSLIAAMTISLGCGQTDGKIRKGKTEVVELSTSQGTIVLYLYESTPKHKANFLKLSKEGFFDGTTFHRVIKEFMIQGGDPLSKDASTAAQAGTGGPGYTIEAEIKPEFFHKKGALAGARMPDNVNPKKESSGSQFYIVIGKKYNDAELDMIESQMKSKYGQDYSMPIHVREAYKTVGGTPWLDREYTVFGEVVSGLEVVDKIGVVPTAKGDKPIEDVKMTMKVVPTTFSKLKKQYGFETIH